LIIIASNLVCFLLPQPDDLTCSERNYPVDYAKGPNVATRYKKFLTLFRIRLTRTGFILSGVPANVKGNAFEQQGALRNGRFVPRVAFS